MDELSAQGHYKAVSGYIACSQYGRADRLQQAEARAKRDEAGLEYALETKTLFSHSKTGQHRLLTERMFCHNQNIAHNAYQVVMEVGAW